MKLPCQYLALVISRSVRNTFLLLTSPGLWYSALGAQADLASACEMLSLRAGAGRGEIISSMAIAFMTILLEVHVVVVVIIAFYLNSFTSMMPFDPQRTL